MRLMIKGLTTLTKAVASGDHLFEARMRHEYKQKSGLGAQLAAKYPGGHWVTVHGHHVYIHNGRIVPETRQPWMKREHDIMARNRIPNAQQEDMVLDAERDAKPKAKTGKDTPTGRKGVFIIPFKTNETYEHRGALRDFGGIWSKEGPEAEHGWHISAREGTAHFQNALDYFKKHGLKGGFRLDDDQTPAPKPAQAPQQQTPAQAPVTSVAGMTLSDRQKQLEAEKAQGLKIEVKLLRHPSGPSLFGLKFTGYDRVDATHRSFSNIAKKVLGGNNYQYGAWWVTGKNVQEMIGKLKALQDKFGPMLDFSDTTKKAIEKHDPEFFARLKATGERADAGLKAQAVEEPMKLKSLNRQAVKPHPFQWAGAHYLTTIQKGVLGFDTGLGKTLTSLLAAEHAMQNLGAKGPAQIIVPASRLFGWEGEINTFFKGKKVVVLTGTPAERAKLMKDAKKADYVIMSYPTMVNEGEAINKALGSDIAIYDEAHYLKDAKSARSKAAEAHMSPKHTWWLTATPMTNNLDEAYRAMQFMNGDVLGEKKTFVNKFGLKADVETMTGNVTQAVVGVRPNEKENLKKLLAPYVFMLDKEHKRVNIHMPEKTHTVEPLDMDEPQKLLYKVMRDDIVAELTDDDGTTTEKPAIKNILTKLQRLEQIATDPRLIDTPDALEGLGIKATNPVLKMIRAADYVPPKVERTADLVATNWERTADNDPKAKGKGTIVFAQSPRVLEALKKQLMKEHGFKPGDFVEVMGKTQSRKRQDSEDIFNRGEAKVILMTKAGTEGMNLQKNSNQHIDMDYEWTPAAMHQRLGRGYRQGQKNKIHHQQFAMRGSIEERKMLVLERKAKLINDVFGDDMDVDVTKLAGKLTAADILEMLGASKAQVEGVRKRTADTMASRKVTATERNAKAADRAAKEEAAANSQARLERLANAKKPAEPKVSKANAKAMGEIRANIRDAKQALAFDRQNNRFSDMANTEKMLAYFEAQKAKLTGSQQEKPASKAKPSKNATTKGAKR